MEMSGGDLHAAAKGQAKPVPQFEPANDHPGSDENLLLAVILALLEESGIQLYFGPKLLEHLVLKSIVPDIISADQIRIGRWKANAESALRVEILESFAVGNCGRDYGIERAVRVRASRQARADECGQNVIAVFLVCGKQAVLDVEREIAETIRDCRIVVDEVRRQVEEHLDVFKGNQLQSFAAVVVFGCNARAVRQPINVKADFFLKARRDRCQRRNPMGLLPLRL